jgi:hypothetical protein
MSRDYSIKKVLVIGSGPIVIGQPPNLTTRGAGLQGAQERGR